MSGALTPRSRARAKRSATNLADLRLAPLSSKFTESPTSKTGKTPPRSPYGDAPAFSRSHSSYLQGKSAPSTPGVLSRTSSKKRLSGGLIRRESVYDGSQDNANYNYAARRPSSGQRTTIGSGNIPKAKSEAFLAQQQQPSCESGHHKTKHAGGFHRITSSLDLNHSDDSWLTHTTATASALLQEGKGQSWLASRDGHDVESTDDDDEEYEEMAALNASTAKLNLEAGEVQSPESRRISRWGSRYGSRQGSRHASRMASPTGSRTPRARGADVQGYFDDALIGKLTQPINEQPAFVERADAEEEEDNKEVARLTSEQTFGLGSVVDKFMNFNLFKVDDSSTEDEDNDRRTESADEARARMAAENQRKKLEKERLVAMPPAPRGGENGKVDAYGWADAAWLLSVASKALF